MDIDKCNALKAELSSQPEPAVVEAGRFFDGNDDLGSIGCNLFDHPGVHRFREIVEGLLTRPDVDAVYAVIREIDAGEDMWPFTDTLLFVGDIPTSVLSAALEPVQPDEVGEAPFPVVPQTLQRKHGGQRVRLAWWD